MFTYEQRISHAKRKVRILRDQLLELIDTQDLGSFKESIKGVTMHHANYILEVLEEAKRMAEEEPRR